METSNVIELKENEVISVQQENCGYTITGPATVIVLKEIDMELAKMQQRTIGGAAADTTTPEKQDLPKMVWGESKWGESRFPNEEELRESRNFGINVVDLESN